MHERVSVGGTRLARTCSWLVRLAGQSTFSGQGGGDVAARLRSTLVPLAQKGVDTAWRLIKTWRALWKVASAMRYCLLGQGPSAGIRRQGQPRRALRWSEGEVVRLVKAA